jgi:hypothetical protein
MQSRTGTFTTEWQKEADGKFRMRIFEHEG